MCDLKEFKFRYEQQATAIRKLNQAIADQHRVLMDTAAAVERIADRLTLLEKNWE